MRFNQVGNGNEILGHRIIGISLNGLNSSQRQNCFDEWAKVFCDCFPSFEDAEMSLPFAIKLPEASLLSQIKGVYVPKEDVNSAKLVMIHFDKGINGITLTITPNLMELQEHCITVIPPTDNYPMALGWADGELYYVICDGWEDVHTQQELTEILLSLK